MSKRFLFCFTIVTSIAPIIAIANDDFNEKMIARYPQFDADGDGKLSATEEAMVVPQVLKRFPHADRDGDGKLSAAEKESLLQITAQRMNNGLNPTGEPEPLNALTKLFRQSIAQQKIAGCSFLVLHKGKVVYREAFGYADIESQRPFTTTELCPIASVSKPVLASVVMALVDQGKLHLDDRVDKYLPAFKEIKVKGSQSPARSMTLRHLLSHTAGFWGNKNITPDKKDLIRNFDRPLSEAVQGIAKHDLDFEPGTRMQYSGAGYCVAGRVAEVALGQSLEKIAQDNLFRPMGLQKTTFLPSQEQLNALPTAYALKRGKLEKQITFKAREELRFILPGGSLFTTMDELAAIGLMHLNDGVYKGSRILTKTSVREMRRLQSPVGIARPYGLGWFCGDFNDAEVADLVFHSGALGSHLRIDRGRDLVTVFLVHQPIGPFLQLKNKRYEIVNKMFPLPTHRE